MSQQTPASSSAGAAQSDAAHGEGAQADAKQGVDFMRALAAMQYHQGDVPNVTNVTHRHVKKLHLKRGRSAIMEVDSQSPTGDSQMPTDDSLVEDAVCIPDLGVSECSPDDECTPVDADAVVADEEIISTETADEVRNWPPANYQASNDDMLRQMTAELFGEDSKLNE